MKGQKEEGTQLKSKLLFNLNQENHFIDTTLLIFWL